MTYSLLAKRLRLPLGFALALLYLAFARPTAGALAFGGTVALVGVVVRGWASGHIVKNDRLATSGPYAHTRNPLYFGSFLIAAGFAVAAHWSLLLVVISFFVLIYAPTMEREQANIRCRFPEAYADVRSATSRRSCRASRPGRLRGDNGAPFQLRAVHEARRVEGGPGLCPRHGLARLADRPGA